MPGRTVDARGKACPQPVIETRRVLEDAAIGEIAVLVDNQSAAENVARMGRSQGCEVRLEDTGSGEFRIVLTRSAGAAARAADPVAGEAAAACGPASRVAVFVAADGIGRGDDDLGRALMLALITTLKDLVPRPTCAAFMNSGVKLTVEGSAAVEALQELEGLGVEVLVCGTCLDFYGLDDELAAGRVSNMFEIASRLVDADRVVRP
jgi:selenium metabolism protein YedF